MSDLQRTPRRSPVHIFLHFVPASKSESASTETRFRVGEAGAEEVGDGHIETSNLPEPWDRNNQKKKQERERDKERKVSYEINALIPESQQ